MGARKRAASGHREAVPGGGAGAPQGRGRVRPRPRWEPPRAGWEGADRPAGARPPDPVGSGPTTEGAARVLRTVGRGQPGGQRIAGSRSGRSAVGGGGGPWGVNASGLRRLSTAYPTPRNAIHTGAP